MKTILSIKYLLEPEIEIMEKIAYVSSREKKKKYEYQQRPTNGKKFEHMVLISAN